MSSLQISMTANLSEVVAVEQRPALVWQILRPTLKQVPQEGHVAPGGPPPALWLLLGLLGLLCLLRGAAQAAAQPSSAACT